MESNLNNYKLWLSFLKKVEEHFNEKGFLKVQTPSLVPSGAMESGLMTFKVEGEELYLPTSPEFSLKKLWLSGISDKIFEISPSFRKDEASDHHLSEFTMLEFYVEGENLENLKSRVHSFFIESLNLEETDCESIKLDEAFFAFTGFQLCPDSDKSFLKKVLNFHSLQYGADYSWSDLYHLIYLNLMEPLFCKSSLIFLENYPPQLAALAKINTEGWASRLEVFYKGLELGNGYDELLCSKQIESRWNFENKERKNMGLGCHPIDRELLDVTEKTDLKNGVGIAIGLERVFSLITGNQSIKVWPF